MTITRLTATLLAAGIVATCGIRLTAAETETKPSLPPASTKEGVTYANDIKPLFDASCVRCHGQDRTKAKLRLDSLKGVLAGSENGKVLTPGDSEKSLIVEAVARINKENAMPPEPRQRRGGPGNPNGLDSAGGQQKVSSPSGNGAPPAAPSAEKNTTPGRSERSRDERGGPGGQGPRVNQGPPPKPLTAEEVGLIRAWIDQGAK